MMFLHEPAAPLAWTWIRQVGPDTRDFLHRLTTVDARNLAPGEGARGCFLSAQGKMRAYFQLWCLNKEEFAFEFDAGTDDAWKRELLAAIDQFTFAEKFRLEEASSLVCRWILGDGQLPLPLKDLQPGQSRETAEGLRLCRQSDLDFGRTWLTVWGESAAVQAWISAQFPDTPSASFAQLEEWRVEAVRPRIGTEITESTIPLEAGLKDAIAENKGCYPGQEVIERIISLGSPARRLALLDGQGPAPSRGQKLLSLSTPPAEVGELTTVVQKGDRFIALGYVRKIHAKEGLEVQLPEGPRAKIVRVAPYA